MNLLGHRLVRSATVLVVGAFSTLSLLGGCAHEAPPPSVAPHVASVPPPAPPPVDPLGPRPLVPAAPIYLPPKPLVFTTKNGLTVWLLERHSLPYVALTLTVPSGSSSDPAGEGGLAMTTAEMLNEGAGMRGAVELSRAVDALGASLQTNANSDESRVSLSVLKKNLTPAFGLFADVIARPRFEDGEWRRLHEIVVNELTERQSEPEEVSRVALRSVLFGNTSPYGHPVEGTLASARKWSLASSKRFYREAWRPDRAVLVAVGDVNQSELTALLDANLGTWKAATNVPPPAPLAPESPASTAVKLVIVDRPDAPQSVIALTRPGVAASDPSAPALQRANLALGGLFTSRLNQDLREEHGYTYGASSRFSYTRGVGAFVASAAVVTDKTVDALKAMLADVDTFSRGGLTDAEVDKTRSQSRSDLVEVFEGVDHAAGQLALDASLGLGPDFEQNSALKKDVATKQELDSLAKLHFDPAPGIVVVVGPRATLEAPLRALGYREIEILDADGNLVRNAQQKPPAAPAVPNAAAPAAPR